MIVYANTCTVKVTAPVIAELELSGYDNIYKHANVVLQSINRFTRFNFTLHIQVHKNEQYSSISYSIDKLVEYEC